MSARRRFVALVGLAALFLVVGASTAALPRTLAEGTTTAMEAWEVRVTPRALVPRFTAEYDGQTAVATGARWPGGLQAEQLTFTDELTGQPALTAVVGSAPLGTDSVRIITAEQGVREATVRIAGWHRVHIEVFEGPVTIAEVAAIGDGGEVLEVLEVLEDGELR